MVPALENSLGSEPNADDHAVFVELGKVINDDGGRFGNYVNHSWGWLVEDDAINAAVRVGEKWV